MSRSIHNLVWLITLFIFTAIASFCFYWGIFGPENKNFIEISLLLFLIPSNITIFLFMSEIVSKKTIPDFKLPFQLTVIALIVLTVMPLHNSLFISNYRVRNIPYIPFVLEVNSLEMYKKHPHEIYSWNKINSSYVKKEYKEFARLHKYYNNPRELMIYAVKIQTAKPVSERSEHEVKYLKALFGHLTSPVLRLVSHDSLDANERIHLKNFFVVINPKVLSNE